MAAELIESDLWTQYAELGGIGDHLPIEVNTNEKLNPYQVALSNLDSDGPQYISSNTLDEVSHATFLNAYLVSRGAAPVDFTQFETLPGSTAMGSSGKLRLTNLMQLNVDTNWYVHYRSATNSGPSRHISAGNHSQWRYRLTTAALTTTVPVTIIFKPSRM